VINKNQTDARARSLSLPLLFLFLLLLSLLLSLALSHTRALSHLRKVRGERRGHVEFCPGVRPFKSVHVPRGVCIGQHNEGLALRKHAHKDVENRI